MWDVESTEEFDEWLADEEEDVQDEVLAAINVLRRVGPALGRPHADTLNGSKHANMKELRPRLPRHAIRVAFAFDPRRRAIILAAGDKIGVSSDRFYKQFIKKADALYDRHLEALKREEK